jgi:hypothetical protein
LHLVIVSVDIVRNLEEPFGHADSAFDRGFVGDRHELRRGFAIARDDDLAFFPVLDGLDEAG